jgi:hypothetical protein
MLAAQAALSKPITVSLEAEARAALLVLDLPVQTELHILLVAQVELLTAVPHQEEQAAMAASARPGQQMPSGRKRAIRRRLVLGPAAAAAEALQTAPRVITEALALIMAAQAAAAVMAHT